MRVTCISVSKLTAEMPQYICTQLKFKETTERTLTGNWLSACRSMNNDKYLQITHLYLWLREYSQTVMSHMLHSLLLSYMSL